MLSVLNLQYEGSPHNGLDDTRNLAKLCLQMLKDGVFMEPNERIINLKYLISFTKDVSIYVFYYHMIIILFNFNIGSIASKASS